MARVSDRVAPVSLEGLCMAPARATLAWLWPLRTRYYRQSRGALLELDRVHAERPAAPP